MTTLPIIIASLKDAILTVWAHHIDVAYRFDPYATVLKWRIDPLPHQVEFVADAINLDPIRLLLADEVGLGKTIMACMLLSELMARGRVNSVLIIVPASLVKQWHYEMLEKFGLNFPILTGEDIDSESIPERVIVSLDTAKRGPRPDILASRCWDLVIFDEAHKLSVPKAGAKRRKTDRYKLAEKICANAKHVLLLTATPHNGDDEDFEFRLRLLNPYIVTGGNIDLLSTYTRDLMVRRLKEDVRGIDGSLIFPPRKVKLLKVTPSEKEIAFHNMVEEYIKQYYRRATGNVAAQLALIVLLRRVSSSLYAGIKSLKKRLEKLKELRRRGLFIGEQDISELLEEAEEAPELDYIEDKITVITPSQTREELDEEIQILENIIFTGELLLQTGQESKFTRVLEEVNRLVNEEKRKVIIFTEYKDTLEDLRIKLSDAGFSVVVIHGGMSMEARKASERALLEGQAQVLVATDAAGEGLNLQAASAVINYELPWNPTKLDQRLGRVHRYKQTRDVIMFNVAVEGTIEGFVMEKLMDKLNEIRRSLGTDKVFDVVGVLADSDLIRRMEEEAFWDPEKVEKTLEVLKEKARQMLEKLNLLTARHIEMVEIREKPPSPIEFIAAWAAKKGYWYSLEGDAVVVSRGSCTFEINNTDFWRNRLFREAVAELTSNKEVLVAAAKGLDADVVYVYRLEVRRQKEVLDSRIVAIAVKRDGLIEEIPLKEVYSLEETGTIEGFEIEFPYEDVARRKAHEIAEKMKRKVEESLKEWKRWREDAILREYENKLREAKKLPRFRREIVIKRLIREQDEALRKLDESVKVKLIEPRLIAAFIIAPHEREEAKRDVEMAAMKAVIKYEEERLKKQGGGRVEDVSKYNLGYDIKSISPQEVRYIEVKGFKESGPVRLTPNEWETAKKLRSAYWLYIVTNVLTNPRIYRIRDPYSKLRVRVEKHLKVVEEIALIAEDWERWAEHD